MDKYKDNPNEYANYSKYYKYDDIGSNAVSIFSKTKDMKKVTSYLDKELKDIKYDIEIFDEYAKEWDEHYQGYTLRVYGNDFGYQTSGDEDYSDEQYFFKVKK